MLDRYPAVDLANALFNEAGDALFLVDTSSLNIIDANPLACRLTGRSRQELVGAAMSSLLEGEEGSDDWQAAVSRTTTFHGRQGFLLRSNLATGPIPVGLSVSRLHVSQTALTLFVFRDMRQTHSLMRKLRRTEQELREVLLSLSDGVWAATVSHQGWHYLYLSPVVARLTGLELSELLEQPNALLARVHPDDRAEFQVYRDELLRGQTASLQFRLKPKADGGVVWLQERVQAAQTAGGIRLFGILSDISEQRRMQDERAALSQRLQETQRLQALGVLAGGVAHDFNNLLTAVLGYASLLQDQLPANHPGRQFTAAIQAAASRGATLTQQMLAYAGTGLVQLRRLNLESVVGEVVASYRQGLPGGGSPALEVAADLPEIFADAAQMRQLVTQLLINAIESLSDSSGVVDLRLYLERPPSAEPPGLRQGQVQANRNYVVLEVRDTGQGMTTETCTRMFEPFFTTKFAGRGLGLAAVLGIVRTHQGAISVTSQHRVGTTLRIYFPQAEETPGGQR